MNDKVKIVSEEKTANQLQVALFGVETDSRFSLRISKPKANEGTPLHLHTEQAETFHVVSGDFKFQVGDEIIQSKVGDTFYIPANTPHCFLNIGKSQGYLISILTPGIHDGFIKNIPEAQQKGATPDELSILAEQFGVKIIGPGLSSE
ncbi:cupin domain-containing protein [Endozoicomonas sp. SCSIO W0465]|uniref:cupin domain-containing protein n=1 Tax=Endozoicomonas sp. SCSIO W0465 TaxID=2918516 RepID=UPI00207511F8|nr:cupin domain-containing protein [Endozoicomonas sp. SCSIO W0465]USE35185.1 cupin domain-containing protein [Endozoicomonas sp. SCSIO W0465]